MSEDPEDSEVIERAKALTGDSSTDATGVDRHYQSGVEVYKLSNDDPSGAMSRGGPLAAFDGEMAGQFLYLFGEMDRLFKLRGALDKTRPSIPEWQTEEFNRADDAMHGSVPLGGQISPEHAKLLAYTLPPPLPFELPAVALDHAQLARQVSLEHEEHTRNLSELSKATGQVTDSNRVMFDTIHELDGGVGALGGTMDLATFGMDGMSAAMVTGTQEAFTYTGQMGTLEDQALSTLDAFKLLAGAPPLPTGVGGPAGAWGPPPGVSAHTDPTELDPVQAEKQRILNMPPPANLEDLFLSQRELGHNISLYADADAWWEAHKRELANNVRGYAGGTPYAPGGMALVGEMGPELVNLPRGSQVIPNPQLGSAVTVNVTVEGSVVAERDLAQRIRQELIRTSRRTVDLGFVS